MLAKGKAIGGMGGRIVTRGCGHPPFSFTEDAGVSKPGITNAGAIGVAGATGG